jgi:hypothetical protein
MCCQLGTLDQYLGLHGARGNLAQRLQQQFGQMGFEIQDGSHETEPVTRHGL